LVQEVIEQRPASSKPNTAWNFA